MARTALFQHPDCFYHDTGAGHPERPERFRAIIDRLVNSPIKDKLQWRKPDPADTKWIAANHDPGYIRYVEEACLSDSGVIDQGDTHVSEESYRAALLGVGAVLEAVDTVMRGEADNAFCAMRPPGHHALENRAMGFCLFNNIAIAAHYARGQHQLDRVLIVDWDVHHGNGTQDSFYGDSQVFFASLHQYPFYPGTGAADERGMGEGRGTILNFPLPAHTDAPVYHQIVGGPLADALAAFKPQLLLVSAGFDAHRDDPLGMMNLEAEDFASMTRTLRQLADENCGGRMVSVLEGGYDLDALAASVEAHLGALQA